MENTTERAAIESNFRMDLLKALNSAQIQIPYPQQVIHWKKD